MPYNPDVFGEVDFPPSEVTANAIVVRLALHRAAMPKIFLSFFISLLVCFRRLSTLLQPMSVILIVNCNSCVCCFATLCVPSLSSSQCTVAALFYDFTDEVIITDEISTVTFVAARLSPLKEYRAPIVRMPSDVSS